MTETEWLVFVGSNERGTPPMRLKHLEDDLELLTGLADILVLQEFKLRGYWLRAARLMRGRWGASPSYAAGLAAPVAGAQPCFWRRDFFKRRRVVTGLMHAAARSISQDRFVRRVLLEHRATGLRHWALTGHAVVGGDRDSDDVNRQYLLYAKDLPALDRALARARRSGWPVLGQLDMNIARNSAAYDDLMAIFRRHRARVVGEHGVEYLFVIDGKKAKVVVGADSVVKPKSRGGQLWTDHEARVLRYKLRKV